MRVSRTIAVVLVFALGVCASTASAAPLSMTFTEGRANVGVQLSDAALFEAPDTAPFEAQIDPGSGSITAGVLQVPEFSTHITEPIDADVTVDFAIGVISGSFVQASGALILEGEAGGTLKASGKECDVSTTPAVLSLSTAGSSGGAAPRSGAPFAAGLAGPGAIAGQWTDMQATPIDPGPGGDTFYCESVEERIEGPGGIWLAQEGTVQPSVPQTPGTTSQTPGTNPATPAVDSRQPPQPPCVVPKLHGKTLARTKAALARANCVLGKVRKPLRRKGEAKRVLVVKASNPAAGAEPANREVHLKLGPKYKPRPR